MFFNQIDSFNIPNFCFYFRESIYKYLVIKYFVITAVCFNVIFACITIRLSLDLADNETVCDFGCSSGSTAS